MGLSESEREQARDMGVPPAQIDAADADMEQAAADFKGDSEDRRMALIDYLAACDRCPLSTQELLDCSLSELEDLYDLYA